MKMGSCDYLQDRDDAGGDRGLAQGSERRRRGTPISIKRKGDDVNLWTVAKAALRAGTLQCVLGRKTMSQIGGREGLYLKAGQLRLRREG